MQKKKEHKLVKTEYPFKFHEVFELDTGEEVKKFRNSYLLSSHWIFKDCPYPFIPRRRDDDLHHQGVDFIEFTGAGKLGKYLLLRGYIDYFFLSDPNEGSVPWSYEKTLIIPKEHYLYKPFYSMIYFFKSYYGQDFWLGLSPEWVNVALEYDPVSNKCPLARMYLTEKVNHGRPKKEWVVWARRMGR